MVPLKGIVTAHVNHYSILVALHPFIQPVPLSQAQVLQEGTSNIQVDSVIKVTFSEPMFPLSVSTNTFTLRIADTTTKIGGMVSRSSDGKTATFDPSANLATSTRYVATISTGATDVACNALSEKKWSFTTSGVAQSGTTAASTVASTNPAGSASTLPSESRPHNHSRKILMLSRMQRKR